MLGASFYFPDNTIVELWMLRVGCPEPDVAQLAKRCEDRKERGSCPAGVSQGSLHALYLTVKAKTNDTSQWSVMRGSPRVRCAYPNALRGNGHNLEQADELEIWEMGAHRRRMEG